MINYDGRKINPEDISQEDVNGMACKIIDRITDELRSRGLFDEGVEYSIENECFDAVSDYLSEVFDYPEYRHHN